jgi:hypothetical protein
MRRAISKITRTPKALPPQPDTEWEEKTTDEAKSLSFRTNYFDFQNFEE